MINPDTTRPNHPSTGTDENFDIISDIRAAAVAAVSERLSATTALLAVESIFSDGIIEVCEPQLKQYRYYQDCQRGGAVSYGVGSLDFFNRAFQKLNAHQKDEEGHYQRGYVFYSAVPVRMLPVGGLFCHFKADESNYRRACVGEVVYGVCGY